MTSYLVTATPPTPNGDLHVGHLSGPYLAADVFARFQRLVGHEAAYLSSTDDHQTFVVATAEAAAEEPADVATRFGDMIAGTLTAAECDLQCFSRTLYNQAHRLEVQQSFLRLYEQGVLVRKTGTVLYCPACVRYLVEAFACGACPRCGESAHANLCEACGRVHDADTLREPKCGRCSTRAILRKYDGLFVALEAHRAALEDFYSTRRSWRPHLLALCESLLSDRLIDYPVSYPGFWGIPVPLDGCAGQVVNVWLEMYPGHANTTRLWGEQEGDPSRGRRLWEADGELVQFLGHDNSFFNAVLHVAIALADLQRQPVPGHIITNQFYFLDGEKFSTSRQHAVWAREALARVGADVLRYHLARTNPEHWQTSFSWADLDRTGDVELGITWRMALDELFSAVPEHPVEQNKDLHVDSLVRWAGDRLVRFYGLDDFSLRDAAATLQTFVEAAGSYASAIGRRRQAGGSEASAFHLLRALAVYSMPLMPRFAAELWAALGLARHNEEPAWCDATATAGSTTATAEAPASDQTGWFVGQAVRRTMISTTP